MISSLCLMAFQMTSSFPFWELETLVQPVSLASSFFEQASFSLDSLSLHAQAWAF